MRCMIDAMEQIRAAQMRLGEVMHRLKFRMDYHDQSSLREDELQSEGMRLHYSRNSHHPEHHDRHVSRMCLLDLLEWLAAEKAARGDAFRVSDLTTEYRVTEQLASVLKNTADRMGWHAQIPTDRRRTIFDKISRKETR